MYVQDVNTRKATKVMTQLPGLEVTSTRVRRAATAEPSEIIDGRESSSAYLNMKARFPV